MSRVTYGRILCACGRYFGSNVVKQHKKKCKAYLRVKQERQRTLDEQHELGWK